MTTRETPTLADQLIRQHARAKLRAYDPHQWVVKTLSQARKFVLDERMSAFSADLAYAFLPELSMRNAPRINALMESLRVQATLPHACMWIEYDLHARVRRAVDQYGAGSGLSHLVPEKSPAQGGWLLLRHPQVDTAFMVVEGVSHTSKTYSKYLDEGELIAVPGMSPLAYVWTTDDSRPPWPPKIMPGTRNGIASAQLSGIRTYRVPQVEWAVSPWTKDSYVGHIITDEMLIDMMQQITSDLRYLWALLAAINDVPIGYRTVTPAKGHMVGRNYKKFSAHTVITLNVPHRVNLQKLAKKVAIAARRRAHQVRSHHREDWRHPLSKTCTHDVFVPIPDTHMLECTRCKGRKMIIKEHQRGDASLGFVLHDYKVEHST